MLNKEKTVRLVQEHENLEGINYHQWIVTDKKVPANSLGIPNPRIAIAEWNKFKCNNPECAGWGLVHLDKLISTIVL